MPVRTARNIAIILLLALGVAFVPGGSSAADTVLAAISRGFLAALGFLGYPRDVQNPRTLSALSDGRRALLYGAVGAIALMIAGTDELLGDGAGTLVWIAMIGASVLAIIHVWREANTY